MNKLYVLCGLPFSGKSTLSKELVKRYGFSRIDLDEVKFELLGAEVKDEQVDQQGWDTVYQEMYKRINTELKKGKTVIHDAGNFTKYERGLVKQVADEVGVETITIFVNIPKEVCFARLIKNQQTKERFDVPEQTFNEMVAELEVPDSNENTIVYDLNANNKVWFLETFSSS